tara:strand:- start:3472 stop:5760 length:2289 start_codon:yes stop_codon:yes gene_type:complete
MIKKVLKYLFILFVFAWIVIFGIIGLVYIGAFGPIPSKDDLKAIQHEEASRIYTADDHLIGKVFAENRTNVTYEHLPEHLVSALVATEDARFYEHDGVDGMALMRVLIKTIIMGDRSAGGGSTITQQLAKNLFGRKEFGPLTMAVNKSKEAILANRLEKLYSKEEIITLYLNTVPFGENTFGIESAAQRYFTKKVSDLELTEAAVLVGMLKANSHYNPRLHPENAEARRNVVLLQMEKYNYISQQEAEAAKAEPLAVKYSNLNTNNPNGYFIERVKKAAVEILDQSSKPDGSDWDIEKDGLIIHTTLLNEMQNAALSSRAKHLSRLQRTMDQYWKSLSRKSEVKNVLKHELENSNAYKKLSKLGLSKTEIQDSLSKAHNMHLFHWTEATDSISAIDSVAYYAKLLNSAIFSIDAETGAILAYVGGNSHQYLPYDLVLSQHQVASTFKPFVYTTALKSGMSPCEWIDNEAKVYEDFDNWQPENYDKSSGGYFSMKGALAKSVNIPTVATYFQVGHDALQETVEQFGLEKELEEVPSVALGTTSYSLYDMVKAYSVFATRGKMASPYLITKIETSSGDVVYDHKVEKADKVLDETVAENMQLLLKTVVDSGTAAALKRSYGYRSDWAGKTGTAQNYSDAWFIGFNSKIVTGVWVGTRSPVIHMPSSIGSGSGGALPIFANFNAPRYSKSTNRKLTAGFPEFDEALLEDFDCPFYREEKGLEKVLDLFDRKNTSIEKEERRQKRQDDKEEKKEGFFKRLFKRKDN